MVSSCTAWYICTTNSESITTCRGNLLHYVEVAHGLSLSLNSRETSYSYVQAMEQGAELHCIATMKLWNISECYFYALNHLNKHSGPKQHNAEARCDTIHIWTWRWSWLCIYIWHCRFNTQQEHQKVHVQSVNQPVSYPASYLQRACRGLAPPRL